MLSTMSLNPSVEITFHIIKPKIIVLLFEKTKDKSQAAENRTLCVQKIRPKYIVELFSKHIRFSFHVTAFIKHLYNTCVCVCVSQ